MHLPSRRKLLAFGAATALALSLSGIALAQDPGSSDSGTREELAGPRRHLGVLIGLHQIVEASGLEGSVFRDGFKEGLSINQVLEANGLDPAAIKAEVLGNLEARLAEKVAAGEMEQSRADEILANAGEKLDRLMAKVPDGSHLPRPIIRRAGVHGVFESAAETLDLTVSELRGEMRESGATIAGVAQAHGVEPQAVIDKAVADAIAKIDQLEADGKISAERAAEIRENAPGRIATFINERAPRHAGNGPE